MGGGRNEADTILSFFKLPNGSNMGSKEIITIENKLGRVMRAICEREMTAALEGRHFRATR